MARTDKLKLSFIATRSTLLSPAQPLAFLHQHIAEIDSTNAALLRRASSGASIHLQALSADAQTAGRGQRGRAWHTNANAGDAMLLSIGWHFEKSQSLSGLSLAVGVIVAKLLSEFILQRNVITLKWPNDILLKPAHADAPRKLGGILIETQAIDSTTRAAVIGIGINIAKPNFLASFGTNNTLVPLAPASLNEISSLTSATLVDALLPALALGLVRFSLGGFVSFKGPWWALRAYADNPRDTVVVHTPNGDTLVGRMLEITDSGALVIESDSGRHTLVSGQVSLRHNDNARS
jgi:BirA family transcriptional regulator, biotin operon repressor / biotin---[acetyl-CoA-carboxylase] ligase